MALDTDHTVSLKTHIVYQLYQFPVYICSKLGCQMMLAFTSGVESNRLVGRFEEQN